MNPNITWEIVQDNPDYFWNYVYLSSNPNINWSVIENNPDYPCSFELLSENQMSKHPFFNKQLSYVLK